VGEFLDQAHLYGFPGERVRPGTCWTDANRYTRFPSWYSGYHKLSAPAREELTTATLLPADADYNVVCL